LSFSNVLQGISIQCFPNSSELAVAPDIYSSAMISVIKTTFDIILIQSSSFWWSSELLMTLASGEQLLMRVLQNLFSSDASSFLFVYSNALIRSSEPMLKLKTLNFCLWSCTLEQILAYPIDTFNTLLSSKLV